ncbi:RIP metalloprotease RseP [Mucilaginibacter hurinus]|uniref:Zinc metalloprotease n=1 Tax=Mucilaginibacter hurinus TaxID=2201324 RepID=A0A367GU81_9SPHI|nr:RIP metalloprotease RseP [Mucilaginibacter hurinus]RCH56860.1 RIP metalloprotease RseP [Mucilaginibacter hurinus]
MDKLVMILQFLAGLCLIVFVHELGHYLSARIFGIRVRKFYLFFDAFGKAIFRFRRNGTDFGLGWLPLGGYVTMAGALAGDEEDDGENVPVNERFDHKPIWQRIVVMLSGILMNFLFSLLVFSLLALTYGRKQLNGVGDSLPISPGKLGKQAGLQPGDRVAAINADSSLYVDDLLSTRLLRGNTVLTVIRKKGNERIHMHIAVSPKIMQMVAEKDLSQFYALRAGFKIDSVYTNLDLSQAKNFKHAGVVAVNGDSVNSFNDFYVRLKANEQRQLYLTVVRKGQELILPAHRDKDGHIAFSHEGKIRIQRQVRIPPERSLATGASLTWGAISANSEGFGQMLRGEVSLGDAVLGPIRIATLFGERFEAKRFWTLLAVLSLAIGVFNLLPVAPLDGGAVVLFLWEAVTRKPLGLLPTRIFQLTGIVAMLLLVILASVNDLLNIL